MSRRNRVNRAASMYGRVGKVGLPEITSPSYGARCRYKNLEKSMNELKMKQLKRRIRGAVSASSRRRNVAQRRMTPVSPLAGDTKSSPENDASKKKKEWSRKKKDASKNAEMSLPNFDEKQWRKQQAHLEHVKNLNKELLDVNAKYNTQKLELENVRAEQNDLRTTVDGLTEQADHIKQQRAGMMVGLDRLVADERAVLLKVLAQNLYTKVLKHIMWRLHAEMQVQGRTLEAFYRLLSLKKAEALHIEDQAGVSYEEKARADRKLTGTKASISEEKDSFLIRANDLKTTIEERAQLMKKAEEEKQQLLEEQKKLKQEAQSASVIAQMRNNVTNRHLRDFNHHARVHAEAFRKILVATGLSREEDVIQRWQDREEYVSEVEQQVKSLHRRLEHLTKENKAFTVELQSGKFKPALGTANDRVQLAEQLEKKKAYVRRFRERAAHVEQKMMEIEQTADSWANKLEFLHSSDKYKPTAHEAKLQEKRANSKDSRNELCLKLEDMQHRIGFLLETIFPDVAHPRGADVDEETTSEIDPDNARFFIYFGETPRVHNNGSPEWMSQHDTKNVRVLPAMASLPGDEFPELLSEEDDDHVEGDAEAPKTRAEMKKNAINRFRRETKAKARALARARRKAQSTPNSRQSGMRGRGRARNFAMSKGSRSQMK